MDDNREEILNIFEFFSVHNVFVLNQNGYLILSGNFMNAQLKAVFEEPAHAWLSSLSALLIQYLHST